MEEKKSRCSFRQEDLLNNLNNEKIFNNEMGISSLNKNISNTYPTNQVNFAVSDNGSRSVDVSILNSSSEVFKKLANSVGISYQEDELIISDNDDSKDITKNTEDIEDILSDIEEFEKLANNLSVKRKILIPKDTVNDEYFNDIEENIEEEKEEEIPQEEKRIKKVFTKIENNKTITNSDKNKICVNSSCNSDIPDGAKFCPECGTSQISKFCASCGYHFTGKEKFCSECGSQR